MASERSKISQLSNVSEVDLDRVLTDIYNRLKATGNRIDQDYSNDTHYVKAGDIKQMNETQKEIFYGIVNDCYKGLVTMPVVEDMGGDNYRIKIRDSENNRNFDMTFTSLGLIENTMFTIFFYIYKLQNARIKFASLVNESQQKAFAKLYTLILNIPDMAERITNLSNDIIKSNEKSITLETYHPVFEGQTTRVVPQPPRQGWDRPAIDWNNLTASKKGGVKRKTSRKSSRKSSKKRLRKSSRKKCKHKKR